MNVHIRSRPFKCRLEGCDADFNELANRFDIHFRFDANYCVIIVDLYLFV